MSLSINYVSSLGHRGPKSTRVNFGPLNNGIRLWAWVPNATADTICEGMQVVGDFTVRPAGAVEATFTDKTGVVQTKKAPTQQVWVNGAPVFEAPESDDIGAPTYSVSEQALAFAEKVRAKRAAAAQTGDDTPL